MKRIPKAAARRTSQLPAATQPRKKRSKNVSEETRELSLSNEQLLKLAEKYPPPPVFFQGDVERPW